MTLPEDASSAETFRAIRTAVAQGFEADEAKFPALKYRDDEGDLCTLVEASVEDMLESAQSGSLRLFASKPKADTALASSPEDAATEAPAEEPVSEEPVAEEPISEEDASEEAVSEEAVSEAEAAAEEPVAEKPVAEGPVAEEPVAEEPVSEEAVAEEPVAEEAEEAEATSPASEEQVVALMAVGFSKEESQRALEEADGNLELAIEDLLNSKSQPAPAAAVESLLVAETSTSSPDTSAPAPRPTLKKCTRMDRVQVFVSKSTSVLRSVASDLFTREGHNSRLDPWVTVQSQSDSFSAASTDDAQGAAATDDAQAATAAEETTGAELDNANAVQADASDDEFTYVSIDPTEANATVLTTD